MRNDQLPLSLFVQFAPAGMTSPSGCTVLNFSDLSLQMRVLACVGVLVRDGWWMVAHLPGRYRGQGTCPACDGSRPTCGGPWAAGGMLHMCIYICMRHSSGTDRRIPWCVQHTWPTYLHPLALLIMTLQRTLSVLHGHCAQGGIGGAHWNGLPWLLLPIPCPVAVLAQGRCRWCIPLWGSPLSAVDLRAARPQPLSYRHGLSEFAEGSHQATWASFFCMNML